MPTISTTTTTQGLPIHRISIPGTRALTTLVAFDAGARSERASENGIAHFLEHLIFKGGERYDNYRAVNETAERMGAMLNAYTSHDLVAFHITSRAEAAPLAIDLLTDIAGRPALDSAELERERGVVIQEIARAHDQPATVAEYLIDRAAFGEHPLGRPVLGPEEHLRSFTREEISAFRERRWTAAGGAAFLVGNTEHLPDEATLADCFGRFPAHGGPAPFEAAPPFQPTKIVDERDTNQSHLRMIYRSQIDPRDPAARAALGIYSTLLGGSMGSRLFDELREQRGLCYSVWAVDHTFADLSMVQLGAGLDSGKCVEAFELMREIVDRLRNDGPREEEVERARAYAAGRRAIAFENTGAVARHGANQAILYDDAIDPDVAIARIDEVAFEEVVAVARGISEELAVACVGPHAASEFS
ncbi:MAG: pitrilysin family protein [Solirubrobacteraceae bacterium]|jgi:predicted Zn-dependent peptidase